MPAFVSLASAALATGNVASLDLCADEYLLMLAPRSRIASVSHLAASEDDNALARRAHGIPINRGTLESLLASDARILLTTRPLGRLDRRLATRLGMRIVTLETGGPEAVARSVDQVAGLVGGYEAARRWRARLASLRTSAPARTTDALWVGTGGIGMSPEGRGAQWLALAGLRPVSAAAGLSRVEQVIATNAPIVLRSSYDAGNYSRAGDYLNHPLVRRAGRTQIAVDGRRFTCSGPLLLDEIHRLREAVR